MRRHEPDILVLRALLGLALYKGNLLRRVLLQEYGVIIWSLGGRKSSVSRDLLKVFGICRMFWIAKNACGTAKKDLFIFFIWLLLRLKNFGVDFKKSLQTNPF